MGHAIKSIRSFPRQREDQVRDRPVRDHQARDKEGDMTAQLPQQPEYPVQFSVDYPDRDLSRVTTAFRIFTIIPIAIVLSTVSGGT